MHPGRNDSIIIHALVNLSAGRLIQQSLYRPHPNRRLTAPLTSAGDRVRVQSPSYYGTVDGKPVKLFKDAVASQQRLAELVRKCERKESGVADPYEEHRRRPLTEHLDEWATMMRNDVARKGRAAKPGEGVRVRGEKHIRYSVGCVGRIVDGCKMVVMADISASRVQAFLAEIRKDRNIGQLDPNKAEYTRRELAEILGVNVEQVTDLLRRHRLDGKSDDFPVWGGKWYLRAADMLRIELDACGIPYVIDGSDGPLFADFHCLRHSFVAMLDKSGATLKEAMQLARHSDPRLTMAVYGRARLHDLAGAVDRLPSLSTPLSKQSEAESLRATGTDGEIRTPRLPFACREGDAPCENMGEYEDRRPSKSKASAKAQPLRVIGDDSTCATLASDDEKDADRSRTDFKPGCSRLPGLAFS